jgi:hypothetical protein
MNTCLESDKYETHKISNFDVKSHGLVYIRNTVCT